MHLDVCEEGRTRGRVAKRVRQVEDSLVCEGPVWYAGTRLFGMRGLVRVSTSLLTCSEIGVCSAFPRQDCQCHNSRHTHNFDRIRLIVYPRMLCQ